jgi:hypothetical protein
VVFAGCSVAVAEVVEDAFALVVGGADVVVERVQLVDRREGGVVEAAGDRGATAFG